jgi:clan AA aspartic protease (TIGR02281 family)
MNTLNKLSMTFIVISFSLSLYAQVNYYECLNSYKQGDYVEAIVCFSKYIDKNPNNADMLAIRAVNDLPLKFIFDTGASNITISSLDAAFMLKNNYLTEYDFKDKRNFRTASGDIVEGSIIRLRKIQIGELELNNIEASVVHKQNAPLLFGQSALGKFVKIIIDNANNEIIFEKEYVK